MPFKKEKWAVGLGDGDYLLKEMYIYFLYRFRRYCRGQGTPALSHQLNHLQNPLFLVGVAVFEQIHDSVIKCGLAVLSGMESVLAVKEAVNTAVQDIRNPDKCGQGWMGTAMLDIGDMAGVHIKQIGDCLLCIALCCPPPGNLPADCPVIQFFHDRFPFP